jgi:hypothetical protein
VTALDSTALSHVVDAAAAGRAVVVDHSVDATAFNDDRQIESIAAGRPEGWLCTASADIAPLPGSALQLLQPGLPSAHRDPVITRLLHLQRSPQLEWLTNSLYDPLEAAWPAVEPWSERDASMLVGSPDAMTSAHSDRHHNLLVELVGSKHFVIAEPGTPGHAEAVARSFPDLTVAEMPAGARSFDLHAGQAVYLPPYTVHWVRSTGRTVALTCGWRSPATERAGEVYAAYATLLRLRVRPRPPGTRLDGVAVSLARLARGVRSAAGH